MQVRLLDELVAKFRKYLSSKDAHKRVFIWESQRVFQENWDLSTPNLAEMYQCSLNNSQSRRLWNREKFEPKRTMTDLLQEYPDYGRQLFQDLLHESRDLPGRLQRFVLGCDSLWHDFQDRYPRNRMGSHYHGSDYEMAFLYLAFAYPAQYSLYNFGAFQHFLKVVGAPQLPSTHDPERFVKVGRTVNTLLGKDAELLEAHQARLDPARDYQGDNLLLVYDLMAFTFDQKR